MKNLPFAPVVVAVHALLLVPVPMRAQGLQPVPGTSAMASPALWQSSKAVHVDGLPDIKPHKKGTLLFGPDALTFTDKAGSTSILRSDVTAVSAGNQRVEIGGFGMRIVRGVIPDGGGLAAAAVLHHRIDLLTVEFRDARDGQHAAVFLLPANEAERALQSFALVPVPVQPKVTAKCEGVPRDPHSVLVAAPEWDKAQVPAVYRALVYEHLVERLRKAKEMGKVYRSGEEGEAKGCPAYTVKIAVSAFKEGNSVKRAALGPVGFFVGTTQMVFDVTFTDAAGTLHSTEQIKATMRGESESTDVADHLAKNVVKHYARVVRTGGAVQGS
ncbi:DUF4410 domain-containing protein [Granulicella paludicola]|uniref:DUF4410 domain-containing protein n=1 Tax=Granulicella paludicola TaxID=474951 RepID=UPI0021DF8075|nr:DUF4410 domain-containing protein [Granulicella paludicola]